MAACAAITFSHDADGHHTALSIGCSIACRAFAKPEALIWGNHKASFACGPERARHRRSGTHRLPWANRCSHSGGFGLVADQKGARWQKHGC